MFHLHAFQSASLVTTRRHAVQSLGGRSGTPSVHKETGGASCFSFSCRSCPYGASEDAKGPAMISSNSHSDHWCGMIDFECGQATGTTRTISRKSKLCVTYTGRNRKQNRQLFLFRIYIHPLRLSPSAKLFALGPSRNTFSSFPLSGGRGYVLRTRYYLWRGSVPKSRKVPYYYF